MTIPRRLAVGIIAPPWLPVPPPQYGGTESFLDVLARGLQAAGQDVTLFTTGDSTCEVPRRWCFDSALGIGTGGAVHESRQVVEAYGAFRELDVVHDHTLVGPLYAGSFPLPPVVTTAHGPFDENLTPIFARIHRRVDVVAISHHQASTAMGWTPAAVIHHGLELERFPVGTGGGGYAVFLGRMSADKGVDIAVRVAREAGIPLRIAAKMNEPLEHEYFAARVKPLLGGDVEYVGEVGFDEKLELLGNAACLLNPLRWDEPFGLVMAEALACGTPVVATRRGSAPEIVQPGRTGFLGDDLRSLAAGVTGAAALDRAECRKSAEARFSARRMVDDYIEVYSRAIETATSRHHPPRAKASPVAASVAA